MKNFDFQQVNTYLEKSQSIEKELNAHTNLFEKDLFYDFQRENEGLVEQAEEIQKDNRVLRIGVVGMVKAGKSSLLNAYLFDGRPVLPKAATAMTAALTRISYAENPCAKITFYEEEDWAEIENANDEYEKEKKEKYNAYIEELKKNKYSTAKQLVLSEAEFEKTFKPNSSHLADAHELVSMLKDETILKNLGASVELKGEKLDQLSEYIGAGGCFTPIVNYVELQINEEGLKGFEIVDTPGLEDTVRSRGRKTREFLKHCNVALVMTQCVAAHSEKNADLVANILPDEGIRDIILIGSRFDTALCNYKGKTLNFAYRNVTSTVQNGFKQILNGWPDSSKCRNLEQMIRQKPICVSSVCYAIAKKEKAGLPLDPEEEQALRNLRSFSEFKDDPNTLINLSGMGNFHKALENVKMRKQEILEQQNQNAVERVRSKQMRILDRIRSVAQAGRNQLESSTTDQIRERKKQIQVAIESSHTKLAGVFENAAIECERKVEMMQPQLANEQANHRTLNSSTIVEHKSKSYRCGFLGLRHEHESWDETVHQVPVSQVTENIKAYGAKCHEYILQEFDAIFNRERFSREIKDILLTAFHNSGLDYDENEILIPLNNVLAEIAIPHITFDYGPYIDEVELQFKKGYVQGTEIHRLYMLQTRQLDKMEAELTDKLETALEKIQQTLRQEAVRFSQCIGSKFQNRLEELERQAQEKERYIQEYDDFLEKLKQLLDVLYEK